MAQLLNTEFEGRMGPVLRLSLWTAILTVFTLGFYRFWMKTRLRRHFWAAVRPDGTPLEYVGKGIEKFTGFLIALVVLALLIGVLALLLVYASYVLFNEDFEAYLVAAVIALPLVYFASYRAKRYVYARTRWRGIRFALEPAAGRYALVAMGHLLLALVSLGLMWPRMTFKLEKFRTDRTFFGDQRLHQGGKWTELLRPFLPVLISVWGSAVAGGIIAWRFAESANAESIVIALLPLFIFIGMLGAAFFYTRYRVVALRYLANHKTAGGIGLISNLSFPSILGINIGGYILTNLATAAATFAVGALASLLLVAFYPGLSDLGIFASGAVSDGTSIGEEGMPSAEITVFFALFLYMVTFLFFSVFRQCFVVFPTWRHYASTLSLTGGEHLAQIRQRDRDEAGQAEGIAEAFDLGAAI
ncbi:hypothetical protein CEW89_14950 [Celeribacter ethanolicus]|uniref:DUF898 domain-containing protein n=1 Tax=Celeribacter ethanolicus TaxID=1758178 RepID=A0A291GFF7_9RHOB|nr:DUF898 family protein [Celeribacter ethanolicus]ATG48746.1 hypothetical protein CEW89_14950 [Celeribacter ethanolicus]TNE63907.1 MAG: DUF898 family protein [Paracoccaceae bacterium]